MSNSYSYLDDCGSHQRLGLCLRPSDVRLHPSEKDEYQWNFSPATSHLFDKQLSEMSTNMYIQLSSSIKCGDIQAVRHEAQFPTVVDIQKPHRDIEKELQDALEVIGRLENEIEGYRHRERTLATQNRRLRQIFIIHLKKAQRVGRCLGETERQIRDFLKVTEFNK
ncbi:hypothetical protein N7520_002647 [Penicillium odoratum]|uniref:uncharacterized protein n=1 Tax=Penicillium odoratum TaxID=1167516 RepID=UPI0021FBDA24|nr:uncharacterized protein N7520_002647 [Penicillium odoratum]KAJ5772118.1 hypothetical protein N7520_002647 [Penicillium odoratum]UXX61847.1 hypothetical protein FAC4N16_20 [Penicillium fuscum]